MVEPRSSKPMTRVRFPSSAPLKKRSSGRFSALTLTLRAPVKLSPNHHLEIDFAPANTAGFAVSLVNEVSIGLARSLCEQLVAGDHKRGLYSYFHELHRIIPERFNQLSI